MIVWVLKKEIMIMKEVFKLPSLLVLKTVRLCVGAFFVCFFCVLIPMFLLELVCA